MLPYLTALLVLFWRWNGLAACVLRATTRKRKKVVNFFEEKSPSGWPGWKIFWPRSDLAPFHFAGAATEKDLIFDKVWKAAKNLRCVLQAWRTETVKEKSLCWTRQRVRRTFLPLLSTAQTNNTQTASHLLTFITSQNQLHIIIMRSSRIAHRTPSISLSVYMSSSARGCDFRAVGDFRSVDPTFQNLFIHWAIWPAMGRCALHTTRSLAVSHATSAASPVSTSSCCIHGWRGRPRGRFHCGLLSGRWPVLALTARCMVPCGPEWLLELPDWKSSYVTKHRMTSSRDLVYESSYFYVDLIMSYLRLLYRPRVLDSTGQTKKLREKFLNDRRSAARDASLQGHNHPPGS